VLDVISVIEMSEVVSRYSYIEEAFYGLFLMGVCTIFGVFINYMSKKISGLDMPDKKKDIIEQCSNGAFVIVLMILLVGLGVMSSSASSYIHYEKEIDIRKYERLIERRNEMPLANQLLFKTRFNQYMENDNKLTQSEVDVLFNYASDVRGGVALDKKRIKRLSVINDLKTNP